MTTSDTLVSRRQHARLGRLSAALVLLVLAAVLVPAAGASATVFPVTNLGDAVPPGPGSLREAIIAANGHNGPDSIVIEPSGTIDLVAELSATTSDLEIVGPGAGALRIERSPVAGRFRVIGSGAAALSLSGMTIANGEAEEGAGILSLGPLTLTGVAVTGNTAAGSGVEDAASLGGGIKVEGPLVMRETTVSSNSVRATHGSNSTGALGGGVVALGSALIDRSTISSNTIEATEGLGRVQVSGGGLVLTGPSSQIERSTIANNSATANGGAMQLLTGGGIYGEGAVTITGSTITGNSVKSIAPGAVHQTSGGNLELPATAALRDTIVSNPTGAPNCDLSVTSGGFNIDDGTSCGLTQPTDRSSTDPVIAPVIAANGGPTPTFELLPGSPAIDRGNAFGLNTDQRGLPRPSDFPAIPNVAGGDGSDIGAFELQAPAVTPAPTPTPQPAPSPKPSPDTTPPRTRIAHGPAHVTGQALAVFRFASSEAGSSFQCKLDKAKRFRGCTSPYKLKVRGAAKHVLLVRAIDKAGNVDGTPARYAWRVAPAG